MFGYRQYTIQFNSVANPKHILTVAVTVDGDVRFATSNLDSDAAYYQNAEVRLRTYNGGGHSILLRDIWAQIASANIDPKQFDLFSPPANIPNQYEEFSFLCDDNPGSHLKIAISDQFLGVQTNCHDEEKDLRSGGMLSFQGDGAMVWLHKETLPKIHTELKKYLIHKQQPDSLYEDRAFSHLRLEAA